MQQRAEYMTSRINSHLKAQQRRHVASVNALVDTLQLVAVLPPAPCGGPPEQHLQPHVTSVLFMTSPLPNEEPAMAWIPVSIGDLLDRLSILELKLRYLEGEAINRLEQQRNLLLEARAGVKRVIDASLEQRLAAVNAQLWDVENKIRAHEHAGQFNDSFIQLARRVYQLNDQRHALKRQIDLTSGCPLLEDKLYG
jgi:hypothetical protein